MVKKLLAAVLLLLVLAAGVLYFRAQAIFSSDLVRSGVEGQLSRALGQPVSIGSIGATILPRVTMKLGEVHIGEPARITISSLDVGTSPRALLSRRIEQATIHVDGARIELPLPRFAIGADDSGEARHENNGPITIGSIDEVRLSNIEILSGGRTLRGDIDVVPGAEGMRIRSMQLQLDGTSIDVSGDITSYDGPTGDLTVRAGTLDMLALQAFATDFVAGADEGIDPPAATTGPAARPAAPMAIGMNIDADQATFGDLTLDQAQGRALLERERLVINALTFGVFEGRYDGELTLGLGPASAFQLRAQLADISMAALTAFAGRPGTMTGRMRGTLDLSGAGTAPDTVLADVVGNARVEITEGTVQGLSLVRTLVVATSMRADAAGAAAGSEAFSRLGASFDIGDGLARTNDLTFESNDVSLAAAGHIGLDGTDIDLAGRLQLSEALSREAGRDLVRYTQEGGRVTVPVTVTGSAGALSVQIAAADVLKRAITNKAVEEAGEAIRRGLGGLFSSQPDE